VVPSPAKMLKPSTMEMPCEGPKEVKVVVVGTSVLEKRPASPEISG